MRVCAKMIGKIDEKLTSPMIRSTYAPSRRVGKKQRKNSSSWSEVIQSLEPVHLKLESVVCFFGYKNKVCSLDRHVTLYTDFDTWCFENTSRNLNIFVIFLINGNRVSYSPSSSRRFSWLVWTVLVSRVDSASYQLYIIDMLMLISTNVFSNSSKWPLLTFVRTCILHILAKRYWSYLGAWRWDISLKSNWSTTQGRNNLVCKKQHK